VRCAKAYPIYERAYARHVAKIRRFLKSLTNLASVGRNGQFRCSNMDHSILTALVGVRQLLGEGVDPWQVNAEAEYPGKRDD
jgi:protoporphyrinogen oxidase